jgi:hypothetical protein
MPLTHTARTLSLPCVSYTDTTVVQPKDSKPSSVLRIKITLNDGRNTVSGVLASQLNEKVMGGEIGRGSVVEVTEAMSSKQVTNTNTNGQPPKK